MCNRLCALTKNVRSAERTKLVLATIQAASASADAAVLEMSLASAAPNEICVARLIIVLRTSDAPCATAAARVEATVRRIDPPCASDDASASRRTRTDASVAVAACAVLRLAFVSRERVAESVPVAASFTSACSCLAGAVTACALRCASVVRNIDAPLASDADSASSLALIRPIVAVDACAADRTTAAKRSTEADPASAAARIAPARRSADADPARLADNALAVERTADTVSVSFAARTAAVARTTEAELAMVAESASSLALIVATLAALAALAKRSAEVDRAAAAAPACAVERTAEVTRDTTEAEACAAARAAPAITFRVTFAVMLADRVRDCAPPDATP